MSKGKERWHRQKFILMALDPIHIGAGGYRLGRVDNTIVREPGTNLPKIPGTSLAGAARQYAAMIYGKPQAAGLHKNCPGDKEHCPIIQTFGTANDTGGGQAGKVNIGDARILFFPVYSMAGPVWVTTLEILEESGFKVEELPGQTSENQAAISFNYDKPHLNLGWLLLEVKPGLRVSFPTSSDIYKTIQNRLVIISTRLFSEIVNSNLEVRTSVAINPETGAAEDGALFTYEALPRATCLWTEIIEDNYNPEASFPETIKQFSNNQENSGEPLKESWKRPLDVVRSGLELIECLGIGGMGTRGFGRIKILPDWSGNNG
jgi:CRISPR-associated protein Cmr4